MTAVDPVRFLCTHGPEAYAELMDRAGTSVGAGRTSWPQVREQAQTLAGVFARALLLAERDGTGAPPVALGAARAIAHSLSALAAAPVPDQADADLLVTPEQLQAWMSDPEFAAFVSG